jgi:hypothetical protein
LCGYFSYFLRVKRNSSPYCQATVSFELLLALNVENFLTVIVTASLANTVASYVFTALGALGHAGEDELPIVRTSLVSASL